MGDFSDVLEQLDKARAALRLHRLQQAGLGPVQAHIDSAIYMLKEKSKKI